MEFDGTVFKIMPVTKGTSARGDWQRQDVVFDVQEGNFTRKLSVTFFNRPDDVAQLREGSTYHVSVNIESREYNGRWYTDVRAWRVQALQPQAPASAPVNAAMPPYGPEPTYTAAPAAAATAPAAPETPAAAAKEEDDLPF